MCACGGTFSLRSLQLVKRIAEIHILSLTCFILYAALNWIESYSCVKVQDSKSVSENYHSNLAYSPEPLHPAIILVPCVVAYVLDYGQTKETYLLCSFKVILHENSFLTVKQSGLEISY